MRDVDADERGFEASTTGTDADVAPPRRLLAGYALAREEVVLHIESLRRKDVDIAQEEGFDLVFGAADGGGGGDDFGPHLLTIDLPGGEVVDGGFVESDERSERTGDQVQLVLDDQVGWAQWGVLA